MVLLLMSGIKLNRGRRSLITVISLLPLNTGHWTSACGLGRAAVMMRRSGQPIITMGETTETILGLALLAAILVVSAWLTNLFARAMYNRCLGCGVLNAKRRTHCRGCGRAIGQ